MVGRLVSPTDLDESERYQWVFERLAALEINPYVRAQVGSEPWRVSLGSTQAAGV